MEIQAGSCVSAKLGHLEPRPRQNEAVAEFRFLGPGALVSATPSPGRVRLVDRIARFLRGILQGISEGSCVPRGSLAHRRRRRRRHHTRAAARGALVVYAYVVVLAGHGLLDEGLLDAHA